jgi:hypothetical protein
VCRWVLTSVIPLVYHESHFRTMKSVMMEQNFPRHRALTPTPWGGRSGRGLAAQGTRVAHGNDRSPHDMVGPIFAAPPVVDHWECVNQTAMRVECPSMAEDPAGDARGGGDPGGTRQDRCPRYRGGLRAKK